MKSIVAMILLVLAVAGSVWWILRDRAEAESPYAEAMLEGQEKAKIQRVSGDFRAVHQALQSYMMAEGRYPEENLGRALGPYMARVPTTDAWGKAVRYRADRDVSYELRSAGPDGAFETGDDIVMDTGDLQAP